MTELEQKRKKRRKIYGEDMTPPKLVEEMLSKLPDEVWDDPTKSFLDPAAGDGNFLVKVLKRKLDSGHDPLLAISTIYGVEILEDNVEEMKSRLLNVLLQHERTRHLSDTDIAQIKGTISHNIVCADALRWDFENWHSTNIKAKELF